MTYSVYGGGRCRAIDIETGRVSGWSDAEFAVVKRGKIVLLNKKSVLRGLKDLSKGHPSTVRDGLRLPQIIRKEKKPLMTQNLAQCKYIQQKVCSNPGTMEPIEKNIQSRESIDRESIIITDSSDEQNEKTLIIPESDLETFRNFAWNDKKNIFNVNLVMYDSSDDYKRKIFFKISPLIKVLRDPLISKLVKKKKQRIHLNVKQSKRQQKPVKMVYNSRKNNHFEPIVKVIEYDSNSDKVIRNDTKKKELNNVQQINKCDKLKRSNKNVLRTHNSSKGVQSMNNIASINTPNLVFKKTYKNPRSSREFSLLEDEAIVAWLIKNKKGSYVNGNQMWKEMQPMHLQLTGHNRSWHSLRNRYLRYILPSLGSLSVSPSQASSLRAQAITGELKVKKVNRRNSLLYTEPVPSAWNARTKKRPLSDGQSSPAPRILRSSLASPSYSQIRRKFVGKYPPATNSEEKGNENGFPATKETKASLDFKNKTERKPTRQSLRSNKNMTSGKVGAARHENENNIINRKRDSGRFDQENGAKAQEGKSNSDTNSDVALARLLIDTDSDGESEVNKPKTEETSRKVHRNKRGRDIDSPAGYDFRSRKRKKEDLKENHSDADYVAPVILSSTDNDKETKKRVTRNSKGNKIKSRDKIVFEISDDDEAYVSRSDTEKQINKGRLLRKLFNPNRL